MQLHNVTIYTDGACDPNPGVGGWAAILIASDKPDAQRKIITGGDPQTTNNRMELTAVIEALRSLKLRCSVRLFTDSEYVMKAFTEGWLANWQRRNWKTAAGKPVANQDLWRELVAEVARHRVEWQWIRGHATDELNNLCDELAVGARLKIAGAGR